jgi:hypothetical protein
VLKLTTLGLALGMEYHTRVCVHKTDLKPAATLAGILLRHILLVNNADIVIHYYTLHLYSLKR